MVQAVLVSCELERGTDTVATPGAAGYGKKAITDSTADGVTYSDPGPATPRTDQSLPSSGRTDLR